PKRSRSTWARRAAARKCSSKLKRSSSKTIKGRSPCPRLSVRMSPSVGGLFFQTLVRTPRMSTSSISNICPAAVSCLSASAPALPPAVRRPSYDHEPLPRPQTLAHLGGGQPEGLGPDGIDDLALFPVVLGGAPEQRYPPGDQIVRRIAEITP